MNEKTPAGGRAGRKVNGMSRYDTLLIALLESLNDKADKLISLFEVSQNAKNGGDDGAQVNEDAPDNMRS